MKVLFLLVLLIAVSAHSAHDDMQERSFSRCLDNKKWPHIHEVYKTNIAGKRRTVSVESRSISDGVGTLTIKHHERSERLVFTVMFAEEASALLQTRVRYNGCVSAKILITSNSLCGAEHITEPGRGVGCIDIITPNRFDPWRVATPYVDFPKRPKCGGLIHGDAHHIDITQYFFCSGDERRGYFTRMTVQYSNFGEVKFVKGLERYGGPHLHDEKAEVDICDEQIVRFVSKSSPPQKKEDQKTARSYKK